MTPLNENSPTLRKYLAAMRDRLTVSEKKMIASSRTVIQLQDVIRELKHDHLDLEDELDYIDELILKIADDTMSAHEDILFISETLTIHADGDSLGATTRMGIQRGRRPDNAPRARRKKRNRNDEETQDLRRTQEAKAYRRR